MAFQNRMELQYRQELAINPRLYQAMDLLQMPLLDLQMHLKQELMVNPFLELAEETEETLEPGGEEVSEETGEAEEQVSETSQEEPVDNVHESKEAVDPGVESGGEAPSEDLSEGGDLTTQSQEEIAWDDILNEGDFDYDNYAQEIEDKEFHEKAPSGGRTLYEYLIEQFVLLDLDERQRLIGEEVIGDINDDGYLSSSVAEIAFRLRAEENESRH